MANQTTDEPIKVEGFDAWWAEAEALFPDLARVISTSPGLMQLVKLTWLKGERQGMNQMHQITMTALESRHNDVASSIFSDHDPNGPCGNG